MSMVFRLTRPAFYYEICFPIQNQHYANCIHFLTLYVKVVQVTSIRKSIGSSFATQTAMPEILDYTRD